MVSDGGFRFVDLQHAESYYDEAVAEVERLRRENAEQQANIDQCRILVSDLVRRDNNSCGSGPGGRITGADTFALQQVLGLALTLIAPMEAAFRRQQRAAERDVIEAAKALCAKAKPGRELHIDGPTLRTEYRALHAAVDALAQPVAEETTETPD